jgi:bifunctional non-homologous end joining protein LigD
MAPLRRETSPIDIGKPPKNATFVEPVLVAEVEFTEWTRDGTLRHPSFKGLRDDKDPREVLRETAVSPPGALLNAWPAPPRPRR